jgi:hypothetical protein
MAFRYLALAKRRVLQGARCAPMARRDLRHGTRCGSIAYREASLAAPLRTMRGPRLPLDATSPAPMAAGPQSMFNRKRWLSAISLQLWVQIHLCTQKFLLRRAPSAMRGVA